MVIHGNLGVIQRLHGSALRSPGLQQTSGQP